MTASGLSYIVNIDYKKHDVVQFSGRPRQLVLLAADSCSYLTTLCSSAQYTRLLHCKSSWL